MNSHTPVTPRADVAVFGCHLDDVFLASVSVRDGVRCPIRQLNLRAAMERGGWSEKSPGGVGQSVYLARQKDDNDFCSSLQYWGVMGRGTTGVEVSREGTEMLQMQLH